MKSTIDSAGRIVIPRDIRAAAGLEPGTAVEVALRDGVVTLEPAASPVRIVRRGKLRVAVRQEQPVLSEDEVRSARDEIRRRR
jgi:AbrB family looped-hinge helix DNA binding protein